jgi:hypothetical protein
MHYDINNPDRYYYERVSLSLSGRASGAEDVRDAKFFGWRPPTATARSGPPTGSLSVASPR